MSELSDDLADALDPGERTPWPGVIEYDADTGPSDGVPGIYLPRIDELAELENGDE